MKYVLVIALFAAVALVSARAYPTGEEETPKAAETETKAEVDKVGDEGTKTEEKVEAPKTEEGGEGAKEAAAVPDDDKCEPGSTFPKECNTCVCPASGARSLSACTLKLCLPDDSTAKKEETPKTE